MYERHSTGTDFERYAGDALAHCGADKLANVDANGECRSGFDAVPHPYFRANRGCERIGRRVAERTVTERRVAERE